MDVGDTFWEKWVETFPDPHAYKVIFDVFFNSSWIKTYILVSVDGGRATIPMPTTANSTTVALDDYMFARIVSPDQLDEYIRRAGFFVPGVSGITVTECFQL